MVRKEYWQFLEVVEELWFSWCLVLQNAKVKQTYLLAIQQYSGWEFLEMAPMLLQLILVILCTELEEL